MLDEIPKSPFFLGFFNKQNYFVDVIDGSDSVLAQLYCELFEEWSVLFIKYRWVIVRYEVSSIDGRPYNSCLFQCYISSFTGYSAVFESEAADLKELREVEDFIHIWEL